MARQADPDHPGPLAAWMAPFAGCFTRPTWANLLILVAGTLLAPGRRTVAAALSSAGLCRIASRKMLPRQVVASREMLPRAHTRP